MRCELNQPEIPVVLAADAGSGKTWRLTFYPPAFLREQAVTLNSQLWPCGSLKQARTQTASIYPTFPF